MGITNSYEGNMIENKREAEDQEILSELVLNERIVEHPTKGKIKFRTPTLEIQRKIDTLARSKKKMLRESTDKIPDPDAPNGYRIVPAFKSNDTLTREYDALGWWTKENDEQLLKISNEYTEYLTRLEVLGFESEDNIYIQIADLKERLIKLFEEGMTDEIKETINRVAVMGGDAEYVDTQFLKEKALSTEVDDIVDEVAIYRRQYECYLALAKAHMQLVTLDSERNALFSDSWQDQLQYYIRLAQVYYCSEFAETRTALYPTIDDMERETDLEFIRWIFSELQAFWQGISSEARDRLSKYSFTGRLNLKKSSSEESPVQPESSKDGDLATKQPQDSLPPTVISDPLPITT